MWSSRRCPATRGLR
ncbi:unnamed protein product [Linum tenue]|uniref:Uncharacterized protein n=1 Tax=Linum tenue TaxID=586396 RepID=A0AAV0K9Q6_9ROSI|nr:unnamed protein product [Linum tenue]